MYTEAPVELGRNNYFTTPRQGDQKKPFSNQAFGFTTTLGAVVVNVYNEEPGRFMCRLRLFPRPRLLSVSPGVWAARATAPNGFKRRIGQCSPRFRPCNRPQDLSVTSLESATQRYDFTHITGLFLPWHCSLRFQLLRRQYLHE